MDKEKLKNWAESVVKFEVEHHTDYSFRATIHTGDQLLATGIVRLSETHNDVAFVPESPQKLDAVLRVPIVLTLTKIAASLNLRHSPEFLELSTESYWIFERIP